MDRESGDPNKRKGFLPPEKQYLITRNGKSHSVLSWVLNQCHVVLPPLSYEVYGEGFSKLECLQFLVCGEPHHLKMIIGLLEARFYWIMKMMAGSLLMASQVCSLKKETRF